MRTDYFDHLIPAGPTSPTAAKESGAGENVEMARVTPPAPHENAESEKTTDGKSNQASNSDRTGCASYTHYGRGYQHADGHVETGTPEPMPRPEAGWPQDLDMLLRRVSVFFEWTSADRQAFVAWARRSPEGLTDARQFLQDEAAKLPAPGLSERA